MKFPCHLPRSRNAEDALAFVRLLSERCTLRPSPLSPCCRPWREVVLQPIPAAARIVTWHPAPALLLLIFNFTFLILH